MKRNLATTVIGSVLVLGGLGAIGAGLWFWKMRSFAAAAAAGGGFTPMEAVEIRPVASVKWRPTAELVGTAIGVRFITLSNEIAGTVREINFDSGSVVKEGDVLLTMDDSTERADLAAAEANILVARADVRAAESAVSLAQANVVRLEQAIKANAVSASDLDQARSDLDSALASLDRRKAEVVQSQAVADQIRTLIAKKTLRAPFAAVTGMRMIHPGQYLAEGSTVVGLQGVSDDIFVDFALPQDQALRVSVGMSVMAVSSVFGPEPRKLEVVGIDATANSTTRNVRVRAKVDNRDGRLRPGMFVDVKVPVGEEAEYAIVPNTAVRRASYGDHVYVIEEFDGVNPMTGQPGKSLRAKQRNVVLGPSIGTDVIVTKGLSPGEKVAHTGSFKLSDGALVLDAGMLPPPGGAAGATMEASHNSQSEAGASEKTDAAPK